MAATVYLIRHAEAEGNIYRRCHGQYDSMLTPRACEQIPLLVKRFEAVPLDAVYSSDLYRARTTAKAIADAHGLALETRPVLREIDMGDWEDLAWAEIPRFWPEEFAVWSRHAWEILPPHGESMMQAGERMLDGVRALARENEGKTIAVVTHGSAIRAALTIAHGYTAEEMDRVDWGDNTCVAKLEFASDGSVEVIYENDASHLTDGASTFAAVGWKDRKRTPETLQLWFRSADPQNAEDAETIIAFTREHYKSAYGGDYHLDPDALLRDVARAQRISPRSCCFGCLEGKEEAAALVYMKTWWEQEPEVGLVGSFCIDGAYRGKGLSGQILGQAISVYRMLGKRYLCAHVAAENERAKGFYRKFAFAQRGEYRDENGLHYRMFKQIRAE